MANNNYSPGGVPRTLWAYVRAFPVALVVALVVATLIAPVATATAMDLVPIEVKMSAPAAVPGQVRVVGKTAYVASKSPDDKSAAQVVLARPGSYKISPSVIVWHGNRYVGTSSAREVQTASGKPQSVSVSWALAPGVQGLHVASLTGTSASLTWTAPSGAQVVVRRTEGTTAASGARDGVNVDVTGQSATDHGLTPGTEYTYAVFVVPGKNPTNNGKADNKLGPLTTTFKTADEATPARATYVLSPGTLIATPTDIASETATGNGVEVVLAAATRTPYVGSAVILPISKTLVGGFLGVVSTVSADGRTLQLRSAGLSAAFDFYDLHVADLSTAGPTGTSPALRATNTPSTVRQQVPDMRALAASATQMNTGSAAAPKVAKQICKSGGIGNADVELNPSFAQSGYFNTTVDKYHVLGVSVPTGASVDARLTYTLTAATKVAVTAAYECSIELPKIMKTIAVDPVPISVLFEPLVHVSVGGQLVVENVGVTATAGFQVSGHIGLSGNGSFDSKPIAKATPLTPKLSKLGGQLEAKVGGALTIGPGAGTSKAGVIAGIGGEIDPFVATLKALLPASSPMHDGCASLDVGLEGSLKLRVKAWLDNLSASASTDILKETIPYVDPPWTLPGGCDKATPPDPTGDLLGSGVTGSGSESVGSPSQWGHLDGFAPGAKSWVLSTGNITDAVGDPSELASTDLGEPGDEILTSLSGYPTYDAASYSVTITPAGHTLHVRYVFASEEYPEWVGSQFNDVMGVFVNGTNCAFVPGTTRPVAINTINDHTNAQYYVDNSSGASGYHTAFDGLTTPLTCSVPVSPGVPVTLRISVADGSDHVLDSAVALLDKGIWSD